MRQANTSPIIRKVLNTVASIKNTVTQRCSSNQDNCPRIEGKVFNVCFPLVGQDFHRDVLQIYFGGAFRFHEYYTKEGFPENKSNYFKNHDFGLMYPELCELEFDPQKKYVVQVRSPIESLIAYYNFQVEHGHIDGSSKVMEEYILSTLKYWDTFFGKWCLQLGSKENVLIFMYEKVAIDVIGELKKLVQFLAGSPDIDEDRLNGAVRQLKGIIAFPAEEGLPVEKRAISSRLRLVEFFESKHIAKVEEEKYCNFCELVDVVSKKGEADSLKRIVGVHGNSFEMQLPHSLTGQQSFFSFSHAKAGSTLLNNILSDCCLHNLFVEINIPGAAFSKGIAPKYLTDSVDDLFRENGVAYLGWRSFPPVTNFLFDKVRAVYLVRDPRDMLISLYYSLWKSHILPPEGIARNKLMQNRKLAASMDINEWATQKFVYGIDAQFLNYRNKLNFHNTRIYRYEDVVFRKREWVDDMNSFLKLGLSADQINIIADRHDILPEKENPEVHIRQVHPGNHRKHFSQETISFLNERLADTLTFYGYDQKISDKDPICYSDAVPSVTNTEYPGWK